jgi:UDP-glucose:(heptosyl)LPS alpha-1,3-glucosyltransferase
VSAPARERSALGPRIALVRGRYDPAGGAERFVQSALGALEAEGAVITIVTRDWPQRDGSALVLRPFHIGSLWRDRAFARAACRALAERRFDLVQSHERIPCCDLYRAGDGVHAQWLEARARIQSPLARAATRLSPRHRWLLAMERALFASPRLRAVICNSEMVRSEIARRFAIDASKLTLIRNAVDGESFHPRLRAELRDPMRAQMGIPREALVALHVGSGFERKGVRVMLEAIARAPAWWGVVAGRDKHAARYMALARRLGIASRVRFVGAVSDVRPYYALADAFVLATLYDPQPNAALEAMASGLPIVTTPSCGAAELVTEGSSGHVRDALDGAGMAGALASLESVDRREAIGAAAREAVLPYTPERMAREYVALYRRLLAR